MSMSGGIGNKGLAAHAIHRVNSGAVVRTPSFGRSTTPRSRISASTSAPKLATATNSRRGSPPKQNATPKSIPARTSLPSQTSPRRARPAFEPVRLPSRSMTPLSSGRGQRDSKALALLAKQLDEFSWRRRKCLIHGIMEAWGHTAHRKKLARDKTIPLQRRLCSVARCQISAQLLNAWACFALRERALRAERQLAAERSALHHLSLELDEMRERLRQAESVGKVQVSHIKHVELEVVEERSELMECRRVKEEEAPSETEPVTEAEAEAEPTLAEPEPQPPSLNLRPHSRQPIPISNINNHIPKLGSSSAEQLETRVGAMIVELHKPQSLPWPETPRTNVTTDNHQTSINRSPGSSVRASVADNGDEQHQRQEVTQDSPMASMRVGSFPGRALLRRLAGPKSKGGRRRGLLDSSSDSD